MAVKIYGNKILNCGTGISTSKDADVEIGTNEFTNCGIAIELRDAPSFIESIGFQKDTPIEKILLVLKILSKGEPNKEEVEKEIKKSGLFDWLSTTADVTTVTIAMYQLVNSSYVSQAIELMEKM